MPITFNADDLKKRITETVQSSFGMLIPQATFDEMVAKEIKAFFEDNTQPLQIEEERSGYNTPAVNRLKYNVTPFRAIVWRHMHKLCIDKLEEMFRSDEFRAQTFGQTQDGHIQGELSAEMEKMLTGMIPKMMAEMMRGQFATTVMYAKNEVMKGLGRGY